MEERAGKARIQYFFNLNCKSEYVMYPVELVLCEVKYVGKPKMACNVIFFLYLVFFSEIFLTHRTSEQGGGFLFNSSLLLPPALQTLRN